MIRGAERLAVACRKRTICLSGSLFEPLSTDELLFMLNKLCKAVLTGAAMMLLALAANVQTESQTFSGHLDDAANAVLVGSDLGAPSSLAPHAVATGILPVVTATGAQAGDDEAAVVSRKSQPSPRTDRIARLPMMPVTLPERPNEFLLVMPMPSGPERSASSVPLLSDQWLPERQSAWSPTKPSSAIERREAKLPLR